MPDLTEQQRAKCREQARAAIERGLRENHHLWHQTPARLDWAAAYALDALGDLAAEILTDGTLMKGLTFEGGVATVELEPARELFLALVASMRTMLDGYGAENYLETEITAPSPSVSLDLRDGQNADDAYTVTVQRRARPTPHEFRQQAEAARDEVLRIVSAWCVEANEVGGVDAGDLARRLEQAGHRLPNGDD